MAKERGTAGLSSRERRRKRRVRNQILARVTMAVLLVCAAGGLFFAGRYVVGLIADRRQEKEFAKAMAAMEETGAQETAEKETEEADDAYTEDDRMEDMIEASIADMPLEDRIGGLFLTTPEALTGTDLATRAGEGTEAALAAYAVGGLVYAASNVQSAQQFTDMITDTIPKSKYHLFFVLDGTADILTEDLSVYGINMEFAGKDDGSDTFRTVTLPSLLGDGQEDGLVTVQVGGEEEEMADACIEAWQNGADLLYVKEGFQSAYEGMVEKISGNAELEEKVKESLEKIYRVKYRNQL